jgi:hypothetical protein
LLGFLDEGMKDDDTPTKQEAIEGATDARPAARAELEQAIAEGARAQAINTAIMIRTTLGGVSRLQAPIIPT